MTSEAQWHANVALVDKSSTFLPTQQPARGWSVTPIHVNLIAAEDGATKVLVTGFRRRDSCARRERLSLRR